MELSDQKQLQDNKTSLDTQWDTTTPIVVIFTRIEDCKLFYKAGEEPFVEKNILQSA